MKKQKSATRFIEFVIVLGIIIYTAVIDGIVSSRLNSGLKSYFTDEIKEQTAYFASEMTEELNKIEKIGESCKKLYEFMQQNKISESTLTEQICKLNHRLPVFVLV